MTIVIKQLEKPSNAPPHSPSEIPQFGQAVSLYH